MPKMVFTPDRHSDSSLRSSRLRHTHPNLVHVIPGLTWNPQVSTSQPGSPSIRCTHRGYVIPIQVWFTSFQILDLESKGKHRVASLPSRPPSAQHG